MNASVYILYFLFLYHNSRKIKWHICRLLFLTFSMEFLVDVVFGHHM